MAGAFHYRGKMDVQASAPCSQRATPIRAAEDARVRFSETHLSSFGLLHRGRITQDRGLAALVDPHVSRVPKLLVRTEDPGQRWVTLAIELKHA
jgi:hypothetical protein